MTSVSEHCITVDSSANSPRRAALALAVAGVGGGVCSVVGAVVGGVIAVVAGGCAGAIDRPVFQELSVADTSAGIVQLVDRSPTDDTTQATDPQLAADQVGPVDSLPAGYRTIGGTLASVNGRPIYTHEVIASKRGELRGLALEYKDNRDAFEQQASQVIFDETQARVLGLFTESFFERQTSVADQTLATNLVTLWRQNYIAANGGSEAQALVAAQVDFGHSLEEQGRIEYLKRLGDIFQQRRVIPKTRPSASDLRKAYQQLKDANDPALDAEIEFSIIEIKPEQPGDATAQAKAKVFADEVHRRLTDGEDFQELAKRFSSHFTASSGGKLPDAILPLKRGNFAIGDVDNAAWNTEQGQVSRVIPVEDRGVTTYFIVKVDRKREALTFEDAQAALSQEIQQQRYQAIVTEMERTERQRSELPDPDATQAMFASAMEIVMQQYELWRTDRE